MPAIESPRLAALAGLLGTTIVLALAGTTTAREGRGCTAVDVRRDAQAALAAVPGERRGLDPDGRVCESRPRRPVPAHLTPVPTPQTPVKIVARAPAPAPGSAATTASAVTR
ncbi:hypothetical protein ACVGVM_02445 [Pseudonocardia bannensis]|uniref:Excalibur calcium-binding domain-containing protein n=1 Tax=Pseudonocardia bannensis TaxID=630973 RepID=A0A848DH00_9PSEU|nr:hypothetical protein [Pseudonocardia bannensis]NMH91958.1 hypothetical protein [Pseudonocardia bannensis]